MVWYGEGGGSRGRAKKRLELAVSVSWDTCAASATGKKLGKTTQTPAYPSPAQAVLRKQTMCVKKIKSGTIFPKTTNMTI